MLYNGLLSFRMMGAKKFDGLISAKQEEEEEEEED